MSISKILDYQKIDLEYFKLENQLRNSTEAKKLKECESQYKSSSEEIIKYNLIAKDDFANLDRFQKQYEDLKKEINEISTSVVDDIDEVQLDYYAKKLEQLMANVDSILKESERLSNDLKNIQDSANAELKKMSKCMQLAKQLKDAYLKKQEEMASVAKEIKARRDAAEKEVLPELLELYKKARKNKKMPFFVPFVKPKTCGGCGMELANDILESLNTDKLVVECPNCGRVIYKQEK